MSWLGIIGLIVSTVFVVLVSMFYGYALAIAQLKRERQKIAERRNKYKNSDTPIYHSVMDDFYDVT